LLGPGQGAGARDAPGAIARRIVAAHPQRIVRRLGVRARQAGCIAAGDRNWPAVLEEGAGRRRWKKALEEGAGRRRWKKALEEGAGRRRWKNERPCVGAAR
jgi:hypothetical protein